MHCVLSPLPFSLFVVFFFNVTATTEIYTLSLHDALPICDGCTFGWGTVAKQTSATARPAHLCRVGTRRHRRSEEHTSELQSLRHLVCRLLLEKKKITKRNIIRIKIKEKKSI